MRIWIFPLIIVVLFSGFAIGSLGQTDSSATASALFTKELKSVEFHFNFTPILLANTNYSIIFTTTPSQFPDGIDRFLSITLRLVLDKSTSTQTFNGIVNNTKCFNSPYTTTIIKTQYVVNFICINTPLNMTNLPQIFNLTFWTDKDTENVLFSFYSTYVNNPDFSDLEEHLSTTDLIFINTNEDNILHNTDFCILTNTSRKELSLFTGNTTKNTTTIKRIDTFCNLGCDNQTGKCKLSQFDSGILALIIIAFVFIFAFWLIKQRF